MIDFAARGDALEAAERRAEALEPAADRPPSDAPSASASDAAARRCRRCRARAGASSTSASACGVTSRKREPTRARAARCRARRRRAAAAHARTRGSGSRRDAPRTRRRTRRARRSAGSTSSPRHAGGAGACVPWVVEPEAESAARARRPDRRRRDRRRSPRASCSQAGRRRPRATARRRARARRSGRAGRGRGCRGETTRGRVRASRLRERSLVDLEQAEVGASRRHERRRDAGEQVGAGAVPGEPVLGAENLGGHRHRRRLPVRRRDERDPWGRRAASASTAPGSTFQSSFPGSVVPPPRPAARERRAERARGRDVSTASAAARTRRRGVGGAGGRGRVCSGLLADCAERSMLLAEMAPPALTQACPAAHRRGRARCVSGRPSQALHATRRSSRSSAQAAAALGRSPTMREFAQDPEARVHPQTVIEHFGTWNAAKRAAGLFPRRFLTRDELLEQLREPGGGARPDADRPRSRRARRGALPSTSLYAHTFGSLANALREAGFEVLQGEERLERAIEQGAALARTLGRLPKMADWARGAPRRRDAAVRVAGLPAARRPARRVDGVPVPRPRAPARGGSGRRSDGRLD